MVFANVFGSIINDILPSGVILSVLMILIFVGILINIYNAVKRYKEETVKINAIENKKKTKNKYKSKNSENISLTEIPERNSENEVVLFFILT